jgi:hypothetical protein
VARVGHEETRRLLLRDDDPAPCGARGDFRRPPEPQGCGERAELAWHGANHSPDNQHDPDEIFDPDPITRAANVLVLLQITSRRGA